MTLQIREETFSWKNFTFRHFRTLNDRLKTLNKDTGWYKIKYRPEQPLRGNACKFELMLGTAAIIYGNWEGKDDSLVVTYEQAFWIPENIVSAVIIEVVEFVIFERDGVLETSNSPPRTPIWCGKSSNSPTSCLGNKLPEDADERCEYLRYDAPMMQYRCANEQSWENRWDMDHRVFCPRCNINTGIKYIDEELEIFTKNSDTTSSELGSVLTYPCYYKCSKCGAKFSQYGDLIIDYKDKAHEEGTIEKFFDFAEKVSQVPPVTKSTIDRIEQSAAALVKEKNVDIFPPEIQKSFSKKADESHEVQDTDKKLPKEFGHKDIQALVQRFSYEEQMNLQVGDIDDVATLIEKLLRERMNIDAEPRFLKMSLVDMQTLINRLEFENHTLKTK